MPRTKQQRPRHILEDGKSEDMSTENNALSDVLKSPIENSSEGAYITDSGISEIYSHSDSGVSDNISSGTIKSPHRENECFNLAGTENTDRCHQARDTDEQSFRISEEIRLQSIHNPFVDFKSSKDFQVNDTDLPKRKIVQNPRYLDMIRSFVAQNMVQAGTHHSRDATHLSIEGSNISGQNQIGGNEQKKVMTNPIQILAKLFHESLKSGHEINDHAVHNALNEYKRPRKITRGFVQHRNDHEMPTQDQQDSSSTNVTHNEQKQRDAELRPFLSSDVAKRHDEITGVRRNSCFLHDPNSQTGVANALPFNGNAWEIENLNPLSKKNSSSPAKNKSHRNVVEGIKLPTDEKKFATLSGNSEREASFTQESQRISYLTKSPSTSDAPSIGECYNNRKEEQVVPSNKLPRQYPYLQAGSQQPIALPVSKFPDFPSIASVPYYSPWGVVYPPYYPTIDITASNSLMRFGSESLRFGNKYISCKQNIQSITTTNSSAHSSVKKGTSRIKNEATNPIDSLHAAIVREAKEMNKGMDPENMYIECPICHKRIKRLYHFQRHMRIHSGEKSHTCPFCPYKSVRKDNLKSHMKTHEKGKYDSARRVHTKRDNQNAYNFRSKSDCQLPTDSTKRDPSPISSLISKHPILSNKAPTLVSSTKINAAKQRMSYDDSIIKDSEEFSTYNFNFPYLSTPAYYQDIKISLPYRLHPKPPQFMHEIAPRNVNQQSPGCITEICSEMSPRSKTLNDSNAEAMNRKTPDKSLKRCSASPDSNGTKKIKHDNGCREGLKSGNCNNSNNLEMKLQRISTSDKKNHMACEALLEKQEKPRNLEDRVASWVFDSVFQNHSEIYSRLGQNGEPIQLTKNSGIKGIQSNINSIYDTKTSSGDVDSVVKTSKSVGISRVDESNMSLMDKSSIHFECDGRKSISGRASSLSLESRSSTNECHTTPLEADLHRTETSIGPWIGVNRELKCRLCEFVALNSSSLQDHMSTHKKDGQYKCPQCDYHGKNLSKLIEHIRIHTGERPFQCDQCSYAAKRKDNLAQHKSVKHDKNRYKGLARVVNLSTQPVSKNEPYNKPPTLTTQSRYASILLGHNPIALQEMPYLATARDSERFARLQRDWLCKLRDSPFIGYNNLSKVLMNKHPMGFGHTFINLPSPAGVTSHTSISSTKTM